MESDLEAVLIQGGKETGSVERGKVWVLAPLQFGGGPMNELRWMAPLWRCLYGCGMKFTEGGK